MTLESDLKTITEQAAAYAAEYAKMREGGKVNKAAAKRARAALNELKKAAAQSRKDIQALVNEATLKAAGGHA